MNDARSQLLTAVFRSLRAFVIVTDRAGRVTFISGGPSYPWTGRPGPLVPSEPGDNYLDLLASSAIADDGATALLAGVRSVLQGQSSGGWIDYSRPQAHPKRWYVARIAPLRSRTGGAVISHVDVTDARWARPDPAPEGGATSGIGIWDWDLQTNALDLDPGLRQLLGYGDDEAGNPFEDWWARLHPKDHAYMLSNLERLQKGELTNLAVEHRMLTRDGETRWFIARGHVIADSDGRPARLIGFEADVTALRNMNSAVENERYRNIFEAAGVAILELEYSGVLRLVRRLQRLGITNLRRCLQQRPQLIERAFRSIIVLDANQEMLRLTGAPDLAAIRHLHANDILVTLEAGFVDAIIAVAEQRRELKTSDIIKTFSGGERHVDITMRFPDDITMGAAVLVCMHDVTELHIERRRYEMATAASGVIVFEYLVQEDRLVVDPRLIEALGLPSSTVRRADLMARVHPADAALVAAREKDAFRPDAPRDADGNFCVPEYEIRFIGTDGAERWFLKRQTVMVEADGRAERVVGTMTDITDRKMLEEAVRVSQDRLRDLAGRLIAAQEQERLRIARDLEHDLNQQLASIAGTLTMLRADLVDQPASILGEVQRLEREMSQLRGEIAGLSDAIHPPLLDGAGFVDALRLLCEKFGRLEGLEVTVQAGSGFASLPRPVASCLYRVAQEALRNAARHSGGRRASVSLYMEDDCVIMRIQDFGSGFDPDTERPWFGLGLTSMRERVRLAGGEMSVSSRPGSGTDVHVKIPLRRDL